MFQRTMADPQKGQIIKVSPSLYLDSMSKPNEINDPAVTPNHCRSEEYDLEKNKKNFREVKNSVSITQLWCLGGICLQTCRIYRFTFTMREYTVRWQTDTMS